MAPTNWLKQTADEPLFPDLLWSRPQTKSRAGKLLIIGGNLHGFAAPAEAYSQALKAGIGTARIMLPDKLKRTIEKLFVEAEYAPSTPSGSFARQALAEWLDAGVWADGVLLAGDLGRNSETAITIESFLEKFSGQVTLTGDALDYCLSAPDKCLQRTNTTLILEMSHLQKLAMSHKLSKAFTHDMNLTRLIEVLGDFSSQVKANFVMLHANNIIVAVDGKISTTKLEAADEWQGVTAAKVAVWWLQNPSKTFEALTTSVHT